MAETPADYAEASGTVAGLNSPDKQERALDGARSLPARRWVVIGAVAFKIREIGQDNNVPIVENPPLARALHATVEIDQEIKPEHYKAVAEVIGYVMRLKAKMTGGRGRR